MKNALKLTKQILFPRPVSALVRFLLKDEAISGKLIIIATVLALLAANGPLTQMYASFWHTDLTLGLGNINLSMDLRAWVSDGLMTFFFLVVGLELKRELVDGELGHFRTAVLPFAAAIGGMAVPAGLYLLLNAGTPTANGWAIPTATDIALAIGLLALLGKRIPSSIRLFLLTLAIVDDILAVIIIAAFYTAHLNLLLLLVGLGVAVLIAILSRLQRLNMTIFVVLGIGLWLALNGAGIHASIAGAILGLLAPTIGKLGQSQPIGARLEKAIIPFSTLVVVPIFAFANTGITFSTAALQSADAARLGGGIILGLVAGKVIGITLASWLVIRLRLARLPDSASWHHIAGVGLLAGIGFTVSIFVTELAFNSDAYIQIAKLSIFVASAVSAVLGLLVLRFVAPKAD